MFIVSSAYLATIRMLSKLEYDVTHNMVKLKQKIVRVILGNIVIKSEFRFDYNGFLNVVTGQMRLPYLTLVSQI